MATQQHRSKYDVSMKTLYTARSRTTSSSVVESSDVVRLFSRTVHPPAHRARSGRVTTTRGSRFHCSKSVTSQQPRRQPWVQGVGYDAGPCLSGEGASRWRSEAAFDWRVGRSKASSMTRSTSGVHDFVPVSMQNGDTTILHLNFVLKWHGCPWGEIKIFICLSLLKLNVLF